VITATNVVTASNDQGEAVTQEQVGTVVVTATGEEEQSESIQREKAAEADVYSHCDRPRCDCFQ
jgi:hypothetical protein